MAPTCSPQASTTAQVDWPPASVHKSPREGVNARRRSPPPPPPPKLSPLGGGPEEACGENAGATGPRGPGPRPPPPPRRPQSCRLWEGAWRSCVGRQPGPRTPLPPPAGPSRHLPCSPVRLCPAQGRSASQILIPRSCVTLGKESNPPDLSLLILERREKQY